MGDRCSNCGAPVSVSRGGDEAYAPAPNRQLDAVREFQDAIGHPNRDAPSVDVPEAELRATLVEEEAAEFAAAVRAGDLVETADAIADLLVVTYGAALCFGIPIDAVFEEVHRTNMAKADGPLRDDGKRLKPPGWTPPDVAGVLARVLGCGCVGRTHDPRCAMYPGYVGAEATS